MDQTLMYVLGINGAYHESSACLITANGQLVAAAEEERFTRQKHAKTATVDGGNHVPTRSIEYCLQEAKAQWSDVGHIGYSINPAKRRRNAEFADDVIEGSWGSADGESAFFESLSQVPAQISELAGRDISSSLHWIDHHLCHAASAFYVSGFHSAAILSVDGIGELTSTWLGCGHDRSLECLREIFYPHSLGFLWEKFAQFLGFDAYDAAKIMGLAAYGDASRFDGCFEEIISFDRNHLFRMNNSLLKFRADDFRGLEGLFCLPKLNHSGELTARHIDVAATLQHVTEKAIARLGDFLRESTGQKSLCLAGGVALNCVANAHLMRQRYFDQIYIQPAAHDAGTALGAAYYIANHELGTGEQFQMTDCCVGPQYDESSIVAALQSQPVSFRKVDDIERHAAALIAEGKIVGWFQGRLEFGPRALGNRSLLADPRRRESKDVLNRRIKNREPFRPFGASVLAEHAHDWFDLFDNNSISHQFMLFACRVKQVAAARIPAVVHVDQTCRIQVVSRAGNPRFHRLLCELFDITGVPLVLNTSFNDNEPIVCSPQDAIQTFQQSKLDFLAVGDYLAWLDEDTRHRPGR